MASKLIDLTGLVFGRLTVLRFAGKSGTSGGNTAWLCQCACGATKTVRGSSLKSGTTKSCGCYKRECAVETKTTHGLSTHPLYLAWLSMQSRCLDQKHKQYKDYGGRGITIHPAWLLPDGEGLKNYITYITVYLGEKPSAEHSLDRIDNDGNYEPGNLRWATRSVQNSNRRPWDASAAVRKAWATRRANKAAANTLH